MKKIVYFLALVLGTGLLFSCSNSDDDPWIHPVPYPKTVTKEIFNVKDLLPKLQIGDSLVLWFQRIHLILRICNMPTLP